ncbi:MAG: hypothetical protein R6V23_06420 [Bacteroidales bacterium]
MFRSLVHITISLLLLTSITGFSISKHYCGDQFVSVKINQEAKSCCDMTGGCCHNETEFYQIDNDFLTAYNHSFQSLNEIDLLFPGSLTISSKNHTEKNPFFRNTSEYPPPKLLTRRLSILQSYLC